jgi:hypothetical protein
MSQSIEKLLIGEMTMPRLNDRPCLLKQLNRDDWLECSVSPDPYLRRVVDALARRTYEETIIL